MEVKESLGQEVVILNIMKEDYERRDHSKCQHAFPAKQKLENTQYNHIYLCACAHTCTHTRTCMRAHTHFPIHIQHAKEEVKNFGNLSKNWFFYFPSYIM